MHEKLLAKCLVYTENAINVRCQVIPCFPVDLCGGRISQVLLPCERKLRRSRSSPFPGCHFALCKTFPAFISSISYIDASFLIVLQSVSISAKGKKHWFLRIARSVLDNGFGFKVVDGYFLGKNWGQSCFTCHFTTVITI